MKFVIYTASCTGNAANCDYPYKVEVDSPQVLQEQSKKTMSVLPIKITTEAKTILFHPTLSSWTWIMTIQKMRWSL